MHSEKVDRAEIKARLTDTVCDFTTLAARMGMIGDKTLADIVDAIKTIAQFERMLRTAVLRLWWGDISQIDFLDRMIYAIDEQYRRAWREGMRSNGLDPVMDNRPEWDKVLKARINQEYDHVLDFGAAILKSKEDGGKIDALYARVDLWVARYSEVVDLAKVTTGGDKKYGWALGMTEKHCTHCQELSKIVAFGSDWVASGWRPQSSALECGGFHCDCSFYETDKPITKKQPGDVK